MTHFVSNNVIKEYPGVVSKSAGGGTRFLSCTYTTAEGYPTGISAEDMADIEIVDAQGLNRDWGIFRSQATGR